MANTCNIFAAFAVAFLASLSLSSAFVKEDFDISKNFQNNFDLKLQPFLREKREEDVYYVKKHDPLELEELSESQTVHERRAIAEETKLNQKDDRKNEEPRTNNNSEEDAKDDIFSYRTMQDLIQAFILADEQDIAMRLQQLQEIENATKSEKLSNLPKRHASAAAAAAAAASSNLLGANLWDNIPLTDLDAHSCEDEAFDYGHVHSSGLVVHELFCEMRKFWHYSLIIVRNLRAGLTLGPLIAEEVIADGHGILNILLRRIPRLLLTVIRAPHHLLLLPDILRDAIPVPSITGALHRFLHVGFKFKHIVRELLVGPIRFIFGHFFHLHHLGLNLRDRLLQLRLSRLQYLHGLGSRLSCEEIGGPIASAAAAAAAAGTAATATATASAADGGAIIAPDYHRSLAEVLSSFRGIYDGYHASGIPHLLRSGVTSISTSTVYSKVTSYLSNIPNYWGNLRSYLYRIPSLVSNYSPLAQGTTATATATASSSVSDSIASPVVEPSLLRPAIPLAPLASLASLAPIAPVETVSSSASASATVTETQPLVSAPLIYSVPAIVPAVSSSGVASAAAAAAATASATASAASASPVSSYRIAPRLYAPTVIEESVPCTPLVSETIENTVSESSSSSVAVASPQISFSGGNTAAAASASASASDSGLGSSPVLSPLSPLGYRPILSAGGPFLSTGGPTLSAGGPASAASASSSASVSSNGGLLDQYRGLDLNLGGRIPLYRQRIRPVNPSYLPSLAPSSASAATAAASSGAESAAAASSASSLSPGGLSFILPRKHIVGAIGHDYLQPNDIISVTLRNKAILVGRVLDAASPVSFTFLRPKLRASLLRQGGRVWNLFPRDFRDPECIRKFNNPLLLRYAF